MTGRIKRTGTGKLAGIVALLSLSAAGVQADAQPTSHVDEAGRGPRRPPPEAFSACEGKQEGADCQVSFHDKALAGVCVAPGQEELFCMPNDMPPPPDHH